MKIVKETLRECKNSKGIDIKILEIDYTHKEKSGKILLRNEDEDKDYVFDNYDNEIKELKKVVSKHYKDNK